MDAERAAADVARQVPAAPAVGVPRAYRLPRPASVARWADLVIISVTAYLALYIRNGAVDFDSDYPLLVFLGIAIFLVAAHQGDLYATQTLRVRRMALLAPLVAWTATIIGVVVVCAAAKSGANYSRVWFALWWASGGLGMAAARLAIAKAYAALNSSARMVPPPRMRAILLANGRRAEAVLALVRSLDIDVSELLATPADARPAQAQIAPLISRLQELCASQQYAMLMLAPDLGDDVETDAFVAATRFLPIEVVLLPPNPTLRRAVARGELPVLDAVVRLPLNRTDQIVKRLFDITGSLLILALLTPLMVAIAAAIRLTSRGPALFAQQRGGFGGTSFTVYKFRTMVWRGPAPEGEPQTGRDDPRITPVGRWLRRYSLDELPQLLNVLRGDMSLVGPRPHAVAHEVEFARGLETYLLRHRVKPGMTGLAQVSGARGPIQNAEMLGTRLELDLWYAENWSIWLDLRILAQTVFHLAGEDVY